MSKEVTVFRFLKGYLDDLNDTSGPESVEDKILAIFSFAMVVGGRLSEYNLLTMLAYAGVNLKDNDEKEAASEIIAFYAGTTIIKFIDNDLGFLKKSLEINRLAYEIGQDCDITETKEIIETLKETMFGEMDTEDFEIENDDDDIKSFGTSFCPKCNKSVKLTDLNKFVIHYSSGIGNPYAEVTCERCGAHYQIGTTWKNAYKFDALGCQALPFSFARGEAATEEEIAEFIDDFDEHITTFLNTVWKEFQERN